MVETKLQLQGIYVEPGFESLPVEELAAKLDASAHPFILTQVKHEMMEAFVAKIAEINKTKSELDKYILTGDYNTPVVYSPRHMINPPVVTATTSQSSLKYHFVC
jgi:hypothetical protein